MRGSDKRSGELFSYVDLEKRVRSDHPLRAIRSLTEAPLAPIEIAPRSRSTLVRTYMPTATGRAAATASA
jgi:hypothetical protein